MKTIETMLRLCAPALLALATACSQQRDTGIAADADAVAAAATEANPVAEAAASVRVSEAWSRAIPPNAPVAAGFMTLRNDGPGDDVLVSVASDAAERVEIHEVRHVDGMARMRELEVGVPLPAGRSVALKPGGYHLMFIGPRAGAFAAGERVEATLRFARAGERRIVFEVREVGAGASPPAHH